MPNVMAAASKTNSCQSVFDTARSQYLQRVGGLNAPVITTSQPVASTSQYMQRVGGLNTPVTTTSQPVTSTSQYQQRVGGLNASVTTTSQPVASTSQYMQRVGGLNTPVTTTSQPVTSRSQYQQRVGGLNAPVTSTSQPVTSSSQYMQRVGGLNAPVINTSQPVTSTSQYLQRVGGLNAPVTSTSQYQQRVGGLNTPVTTTSTAALSMPTYNTGKVGRNVGGFAAAKLDTGVLSRYSQPLSSCVAADDPHTSLSTSNTVMSHRMFTCSSSQNVATKPSVTAACVANTELSWSSGVSSCPITRVTTSSSGGYVSPFLKDKMREASCERPALVTSSHVSSTNSTPLTSHHEVTAVTASLAADRPVRTPHQHRSAKTSVVDGSEYDRAMVNSIVQKLAEARERKQQSRCVGLVSVPAVDHHLPVESVVAVNSATASSSTDTQLTSNNKTEWQLEAQRRQTARSGVYIDPQKHPKEAAKQHIGRQQLLDLPGKDAWSQVHQKALGNGRKTQLTSDTAADCCIMRSDRTRDLLYPVQRQITASDVRSEQRRWRSKKSASIAFEFALCLYVFWLLLLSILC